MLFVVLVLLITIRFKVLNKSFLFNAFEKHNVYAKLPSLIADSLQNTSNLSEEEKAGYAEFIKNIPPKNIKPLAENNLTQIIDFLNGQSKDVAISFTLPGVGFENASGINWKLSQMPDKNLQKKLMMLGETDNAIIIAGIAVLTVLAGLIILFGRKIMLIDGIFVVTVGLLSKFIFIIIGGELINGQELIQKMLGLLFASLSPGITNTWIAAGGIMILLWLSMFILDICRKTQKREKSPC